MLPTTILVGQRPRCIIRPTDMKDLQRFLRNAKVYLHAGGGTGDIGHREPELAEAAKWHDALALHRICGGEDDAFFGVPL